MEENISIARACKIMDIYRSFFYYQSRKDDSEVEHAIRTYARDGEGFDKLLQRLQKDGYEWSRNKVRRVYMKLHFNKRVRLKKRVPAREKRPLVQTEGPNQMWSMDFVSDVCESGRKFRVLNIIDDFNREAVAQEPATSIPAEKLVRFVELAISEYGKPRKIRTDNGPEFISKVFEEWCKGNGIEHMFTQPGKPMQNGYIERFNGSYRRGVLDVYIFRNIAQVREITEEWRTDYNENRPHDALDGMSPVEYRKKYERQIDLLNGEDSLSPGTCQGQVNDLRSPLPGSVPDSFGGLTIDQSETINQKKNGND